MAENKGRLITEKIGEITIISFMDAQIRNQSLVDRIGGELVELVSDRFKPRMIVNFEKVEYLSSSMLGKLIAAHKRVVQGGGKLVLCAIRPVINEVFHITRLDRVFEMYPDVSKAVDALERV